MKHVTKYSMSQVHGPHTGIGVDLPIKDPSILRVQKIGGLNLFVVAQHDDYGFTYATEDIDYTSLHSIDRYKQDLEHHCAEVLADALMTGDVSPASKIIESPSDAGEYVYQIAMGMGIQLCADKCKQLGPWLVESFDVGCSHELDITACNDCIEIEIIYADKSTGETSVSDEDYSIEVEMEDGFLDDKTQASDIFYGCFPYSLFVRTDDGYVKVEYGKDMHPREWANGLAHLENVTAARDYLYKLFNGQQHFYYFAWCVAKGDKVIESADATYGIEIGEHDDLIDCIIDAYGGGINASVNRCLDAYPADKTLEKFGELGVLVF